MLDYFLENLYIIFLLRENIILCLTVTGKANGAPPVKLVLVGSIPTPKFFSAIIKNFEGGAEPEIEDLQTALGCDADVRGLQVAMHDPLVVRGLEAVGNLASIVERGRERDGAREQVSPSTSSMTMAPSSMP